VDAGQLLDFVDSGRDLLLAVDSRASDEMRRARCQAVCHALHVDRPAMRRLRKHRQAENVTAYHTTKPFPSTVGKPQNATYSAATFPTDRSGVLCL